MTGIPSEKRALRKAIKQQRDALDLKKKKIYDAKICLLLKELIAKKKCKVVHAYIPMGSEIDISPLLQYLLQQEITIVTPKTLINRELQHLVLNSLEDLESGIYGTSHPKNGVVFNGIVDLIIVPGLAFDKEHYRLGYGGGYYDTFLDKHIHAIKVGVAYPFQNIHKIPKEAHDACLDMVLLG